MKEIFPSETEAGILKVKIPTFLIKWYFFTKGSHLYDLYEASLRGCWGEFSCCFGVKESSMSAVKFSFTSFPDVIQSSIKVKEKRLEKGTHF